MRTSTFKYFVFVGLFLVLIACSTKKDTFVSRNYHAVTTEFNILYNGNIALEKGIQDLKTEYKDNFWEILPVERMLVKEEITIYADSTKNTDFIKAEEKAVKAIQKHSMNIAGNEKNPQMDEAHLLLGKARYYEQRFIPALEAFNYILYKYSNSDKIYEAKVWREKTNIRMDYDELAIKNLKKLLSDVRFKDQIVADANAILTQAYLNVENKDSAIVSIKKATEFTKSNEEKARYRFILGQLYEEVNKQDSAYIAYQSVIEMNRRSPRRYVIQAHAKQAQYFDFENGDRVAFIKKYNDLLKDRENRPYLDILNHQVGLFYQKLGNDSLAVVYYNKSLRSLSEDDYLKASSYRNLAIINFDKANYPLAGQYYDSTLVNMNPKTREHRDIKKKREDLVDVIKYESIAKVNDSILDVVALSEAGKAIFFQEYIDKIKKEDFIKKNAKIVVSGSNNSVQSFIGGGSSSSTFYFYNPTTVAYGKSEFKKKWGNRTLKNNWRRSKIQTIFDLEEDNIAQNVPVLDVKEEEIKYTVKYYLDQLPTEPRKIDSINRERNFAYYQLGLIYKDKFKEYNLAADKLEKLLAYHPEERLILPTKYNLYKIYEIIDKNKTEQVKQDILSKYPGTRYAQIISNPGGNVTTSLNDPEVVYVKLYKKYEQEDYKTVLNEIDSLIKQFSADDIISKYEFLKANTIGKLKGLEEYKTALSSIVLNYPNSDEGKEAADLLKKDIPQLEKLEFDQFPVISWKVIYKVDIADENKIKYIQGQLTKFIADQKYYNMKLSLDNYIADEKFIVVHGFTIEEEANGFVSTLFKENKKYKMTDTAYVISNDNYKIVQIKKNFTQYLEFKNK